MSIRRNRSRGAWLAAGTLALATGAATALVATAPAHATEISADNGALSWGFKSSFRDYVGGQLFGTSDPAKAPIAERIVPIAPATFDPAEPAVPTTEAEVKRPYSFPVASGDVTDADNLTVNFGGGVEYYYPNHTFDITFTDLSLVVEDGVASIEAVPSFATVSDANSDPAVYDWVTGPATTGAKAAIAVAGSVDVAVNGDAVTISGHDVTITEAGATALNGFYSAGTAVDDFSVTASLVSGGDGGDDNGDDDGDGGDEETNGPAITLSKSIADPAGDTVTVTGTGFGPNGLAASQPLAGHPAGFYVAFGKYQDFWKPSEGAPSSNRKNGANGSGVKWVVNQESYDVFAANYPQLLSQVVLLNPDGSFQLTLNVAAVAGSITAETPGTFGIYTYGAGGANNADLETFTPLFFATDGAQSIVANIVHQPGGEFSWTIPTNNPVNLTGLSNKGAYLQATGAINPVSVTDTRSYQTNNWSLAGQVGDFAGAAGTFSGGFLGWTPKVTTAGGGASEGGAVAPGYPSGAGLSASSVLGSAANGHPAGTAGLGADLKLQVPAETPEGVYTATLTLTALS